MKTHILLFLLALHSETELQLTSYIEIKKILGLKTRRDKTNTYKIINIPVLGTWPRAFHMLRKLYLPPKYVDC